MRCKACNRSIRIKINKHGEFESLCHKCLGMIFLEDDSVEEEETATAEAVISEFPLMDEEFLPDRDHEEFSILDRRDE